MCVCGGAVGVLDGDVGGGGVLVSARGVCGWWYGGWIGVCGDAGRKFVAVVEGYGM
jgi:hypothetical protein